MSYYRRGLRSLKEAKNASNMRLDFGKWFYLKKDTSAKIIINTENINEAPVLYIHNVFIPKQHDNIGWKLRCTCRSYGEPNAQICRVCNEGLYSDYVKRSLYLAVHIIDLSIFKEWSHTPKWLMLRRNEAMALSKLVESKSKIENLPDGQCRGMLFQISRIGDSSASTGNHFDYLGLCDMNAFTLGSTRTPWYKQKMVEVGRIMSEAEAAQEFFAMPEIDKDFAPSQEKEDYLISYVKRATGQAATQGGEGPSSSGPSWAAPQHSVVAPGDSLPMVGGAGLPFESPTPAPQVSPQPSIMPPDSLPMLGGAGASPPGFHQPLPAMPTNNPMVQSSQQGPSDGVRGPVTQAGPLGLMLKNNTPPEKRPEASPIRDKFTLPSSVSGKTASPFDGYVSTVTAEEAAGYSDYGKVSPPEPPTVTEEAAPVVAPPTAEIPEPEKKKRTRKKKTE